MRLTSTAAAMLLRTLFLGLLALAALPLSPSGKSGDTLLPGAADSSWRTPEAERVALKVPPGFEVQLVAAEPEIDKPMNLAFDARGRLWVSHSREYPIAAAPGAGRDRVSILGGRSACRIRRSRSACARRTL